MEPSKEIRQAIVFVFFGQDYWEQFELSIRTIPNNIDVFVITDNRPNPDNYFEQTNLLNGFPYRMLHGVSPETVFDKLTYRKNIHNLVDLNQYSQIWYADPDILFTGDIFEKYKDSKAILVSNEPDMTMQNEHFNGGFTDIEITEMVDNFAPAINGGLYCVPKCCYSFFNQYESLLNIFSESQPTNMANDQHALNNLFHRKLNNFELFERGDVGFPTRNSTGKYVNHYIGMGMYKLNLMKDKLGISHE